jgi:hypothetical protein
MRSLVKSDVFIDGLIANFFFCLLILGQLWIWLNLLRLFGLRWLDGFVDGK